MTVLPETSLPEWVDHAAVLPVAFAQVREDALLDQCIVARLNALHPGGPGARVMMIASGGCTAAALVAFGGISRLHLIDINPAQIALTRLKLHLLQTASPPERRSMRGHEALAGKQRAGRLTRVLNALYLSSDALGPMRLVAQLGPDHAGRYEVMFNEMRVALADVNNDLWSLLILRNAAEQARRVEPDTVLGRAIDEAFDRVMALPNLVRLFGVEATRNSREPFARHFARRTRHALETGPAADNPYLWQLLGGRFPPGTPYPWLDAAAPARMPEVTFSVQTMEAALDAAAPGSFDFVHLSNILDWLAPDRAAALLDRAAAALRPGGLTLIRQLNSTLDIPSLGPRFEWLTDAPAALHARDRSFFYRSLHLGRRR